MPQHVGTQLEGHLDQERRREVRLVVGYRVGDIPTWRASEGPGRGGGAGAGTATSE